MSAVLKVNNNFVEKRTVLLQKYVGKKEILLELNKLFKKTKIPKRIKPESLERLHLRNNLRTYGHSLTIEKRRYYKENNTFKC